MRYVLALFAIIFTQRSSSAHYTYNISALFLNAIRILMHDELILVVLYYTWWRKSDEEIVLKNNKGLKAEKFFP